MACSKSKTERTGRTGKDLGDGLWFKISILLEINGLSYSRAAFTIGLAL